MTHGSLYSGIGGWLLAAQWAGIENVFTCEIEDFPNKVLDKHFPDTDRHHDIKETDFTKYAGRIDILSTSDPCQPFSFAGKRGGTTDDRFLWPFTIEAIRTIKPSYVVFENVPGFIGLALERIASDLEKEGYIVESFVFPAISINAKHRRDRLWLIAYSGSIRQRNEKKEQGLGRNRPGKRNCTEIFQQRIDWSRCGASRKINGIPNRVDRLKSLGNAIVPQIAYIIFEAIKNAEAHQDIP